MNIAADIVPDKPTLYERAVLSRVIAVVTGKGGILKTATICAIAAMAAWLGMRVLVVDMDQQGTTSKLEFGLEGTPDDDNGASLAKALMAVMMADPEDFEELPPVRIVEGVRRYPSGGQVDLIVGGPKLASTLEVMTTVANVQKKKYGHCLAVVLAKVAPGYALSLVDNDPGDKPVRLMVLEAAAASYAPIDFDPAAYSNGLKILIDEIAEARQTNPEHIFIGAVGGRLPDATMRSWVKERNRRASVPEQAGNGRGGKMAKIAGRVVPILEDPVFDYERSVVPGYPKLFDAMIRNAALDVSEAREAGVTIIDYLLAKCPPEVLAKITPEATKEELKAVRAEVFELFPILGEYHSLTRELLTAVNAVETARRAA